MSCSETHIGKAAREPVDVKEGAKEAGEGAKEPVRFGIVFELVKRERRDAFQRVIAHQAFKAIGGGFRCESFDAAAVMQQLVIQLGGDLLDELVRIAGVAVEAPLGKERL